MIWHLKPRPTWLFVEILTLHYSCSGRSPELGLLTQCCRSLEGREAGLRPTFQVLHPAMNDNGRRRWHGFPSCKASMHEPLNCQCSLWHVCFRMWMRKRVWLHSLFVLHCCKVWFAMLWARTTLFKTHVLMDYCENQAPWSLRVWMCVEQATITVWIQSNVQRSRGSGNVIKMSSLIALCGGKGITRLVLQSFQYLTLH